MTTTRTAVMDLGALSRAPGDFWAALRAGLPAAGRVERVLDDAETIAAGQTGPVREPLVRWHLLQRKEPEAWLVALFLYEAEVERARVEQALGAGLTGRLLDTGVLRASDGLLAADLRLGPFDGVWILSDKLSRDGDPAMGPSLTTDVVRRALPPVAGRSLLDVGCGAGSLAIWAAARGARAVGTDLSPRALELSRLNALLNDVSCEWQLGDLTAPVAGRAFDLVVSQPPFLIQPPDVGAVTYLHGGATGVELPFRLLSQVEGVLAPEGRALVLLGAPVESTPLGQRVLRAINLHQPAGVLVSVGSYLLPDALAVSTASVSHAHADAAYASTVTRYRAHLDGEGIERFVQALVEVRRLPPGARTFAATMSWNRLVGLGADAFERAWRSVDLLGRGPAALLAAPLRLAEGAKLRVEQPFEDDDARTFTLSFGGGAIQEQVVDEESVAVLRALASGGTVAAACQELAEPGRAAELHDHVLNLVRNLLLHGVIVPV